MSLREELHAEIDKVRDEDLDKVRQYLLELHPNRRMLTIDERRAVLRNIGIHGLPTIPAECLRREALYEDDL